MWVFNSDMKNIYQLIYKDYFNYLYFLKSDVCINELITTNLLRNYKVNKLINFYKIRVFQAF